MIKVIKNRWVKAYIKDGGKTEFIPTWALDEVRERAERRKPKTKAKSKAKKKTVEQVKEEIANDEELLDAN